MNMKKISGEFLDGCNAGNCCANELVALPVDGDVGFEEYYEHKANEIVKVKNIHSPPEQNRLMLAYPRPDVGDGRIFDFFFDSPAVVAKNQRFEGCFAIDVSAYSGKENDEHFDDLMAYMHQHKETVYLLFMHSNNINEIEAIYQNVAQYGELRKTIFSLPAPEQLTEYTVAGIRDFSLHVKRDVYTALTEHYSQQRVGYDYADYLIRYLKNNGYQGDLPTMETALGTVGSMAGYGKGNAGFGY